MVTTRSDPQGRPTVFDLLGTLPRYVAPVGRLDLASTGLLLRAREIEVLKRSRRETHMRVTLVEGKNRELRRLFAACGHEVTRLKRVAFGGLELGSLAPGRWRVLAPAELRRAFPGAPIKDS